MIFIFRAVYICCVALLFVVLFYCRCVGPITAVTNFGFFFEVACCRLLSV